MGTATIDYDKKALTSCSVAAILGFFPGEMGVPPSGENLANPPSDTCPHFWTKAWPPAEVCPWFYIRWVVLASVGFFHKSPPPSDFIPIGSPPSKI